MRILLLIAVLTITLTACTGTPQVNDSILPDSGRFTPDDAPACFFEVNGNGPVEIPGCVVTTSQSSSTDDNLTTMVGAELDEDKMITLMMPNHADECLLVMPVMAHVPCDVVIEVQANGIAVTAAEVTIDDMELMIVGIAMTY